MMYGMLLIDWLIHYCLQHTREDSGLFICSMRRLYARGKLAQAMENIYTAAI